MRLDEVGSDGFNGMDSDGLDGMDSSGVGRDG